MRESNVVMSVELERIGYLRDCALNLLQSQGYWQDVENYPGRIRSFDQGSLMILYRTPFQPPPVSQAALDAGIPESEQRRAACHYGLDIWFEQKKVFSLIWDIIQECQVIVFKPDANFEGWEYCLESLNNHFANT